VKPARGSVTAESAWTAFPKAEVRRLPRFRVPLERPVTEGGVIEMPAGDFVQVANGDGIRFVAHLEFRGPSGALPAAERGHHYHRVRTETFTVIRGRLRGRWLDLDTGRRIEELLEPGDQVTVRPRCAHAYVALEDAAAVECASHAFDPADTVPHHVD
jgi:hypothetical protein